MALIRESSAVKKAGVRTFTVVARNPPTAVR